MRLRTFLADDLADLLAAQLLDEPGRHEERDHHGRDRGHDRAERRVPQHVEPREPRHLVAEWKQQLVHHVARPLAASSRATTFSARTPREALTSTTAGPVRRASSSSAAPSASGTNSLGAPSAAADSCSRRASPPTAISSRG